jgi:hypothetical protein
MTPEHAKAHDDVTQYDKERAGKYLTGTFVKETIDKKNGDPLYVVIANWQWYDTKDMNTGENERVIKLSFQGTDRQWILRRGEARDSLTDLLGINANDWVGMKIQLTVKETKTGYGVRVSPRFTPERVGPKKSIDDDKPF